jgi:hypothetical protein
MEYIDKYKIDKKLYKYNKTMVVKRRFLESICEPDEELYFRLKLLENLQNAS